MRGRVAISEAVASIVDLCARLKIAGGSDGGTKFGRRVPVQPVRAGLAGWAAGG